jgi:transposase
MGPTQERETKLFFYGVDLEKRVRPNNPLRQIAAAVDFSFARAAVKHLYGNDGHGSEDPIVSMKLMLLMFFGQHKQRTRTREAALGIRPLSAVAIL